MPLTDDQRRQLLDAAAAVDDPTDREHLTRLAGDVEPAPDPKTAQTERVRQLLAAVAERTGIK